MKDPNWYGYQIAAWVVTVMVGLAGIGAGVATGWQSSLVLGGFCAALAIYLSCDRLAPRAFNAIISGVITVNAVGWAWRLFNTVYGYDEAAHVLGTFGMTLVITWYAYWPIVGDLRRYRGEMLLVVLSMGISLGTIWEMVEVLGFSLFAPHQMHSLNDKISDLAFDALGAFAAVFVYRWGLAAHLRERIAREERAEERAAWGEEV